MTNFVQDPGIKHVRECFQSKETVRLLVQPAELQPAQLGARIHKAIQAFRQGKEPRDRAGVNVLMNWVLMTVHEDEFDSVIVPLVEDKTIKHVHVDREFSVD